MSVSIMERLTLGKELSGLMQEQKTASVLQRMTIGKQIVEVMLKLGLGAAPAPVPPLEPVPELTGTPPAEDTPQVVKDFLAGAFSNVPQMEFIDTLRAISEYVGTFLTLENAKEQTVSWVKTNGYSG
ncbi:hypothetical protein ACSI5N_25270 (plasmid) [Raoultella ornithinolytica]|uniref:hypothetical protein n=1 Tax=Raoultella ornithinolytica TaxID=54291 RepID=UPI00292B59CA|nr:hypothetical protein [Raoultella ornithinolytica]MDV1094937.1 hypothetical protein [Raoultella ornithinolytica]MDV1122719.1 hypothetical protein [Raoultella ornithinolytica]MDV1893234.1 hypothetical protein [Raoultella ornithinolytica]